MSIDQALPQLATVGTTFRLIRGEDIEDFAASLERSRAFHTCGMDKLCSHVARLENGGKYEIIKSNSEAKNAQVSALWEKEQPGKSRFHSTSFFKTIAANQRLGLSRNSIVGRFERSLE